VDQAASVNLFCWLRFGPRHGWQGSHQLAQRANLPFVFDFANARLAITVSVMNFTFALLPAARVVNVSPIAAPKYA
jgi:hypothetical protein